VFTNVFNPRAFIERKTEYKETRVKRGASIGANATIVCGVTLGRYCFVGAGAVVTRDVPDYATVYGNPARVRGWTCWCGEQLPMSATPGMREEAACSACGRRYVRDDLQVAEVGQPGGN
jgi:UDP-2-acetamido-3-amino-2,3-dideoxy-glucuronate N-acetyltransferase